MAAWRTETFAPLIGTQAAHQIGDGQRICTYAHVSLHEENCYVMQSLHSTYVEARFCALGPNSNRKYAEIKIKHKTTHYTEKCFFARGNL